MGRSCIWGSLLRASCTLIPPPRINDVFDVNSYAWSSIEHHIWSRHHMRRMVCFKIQLGRPTDIHRSYFFFYCTSQRMYLSAHVPGLCMFISALTLMLFLRLVAFNAWPDGVVSL
ncbi:hypothetical protein K443DRAFT_227238 [Laccaria amethystina LaAM-08-1]|uniref:Uncharacterized protein n=1 Tax=Laccaria amethystina LaAM-08-1 TaxID=1095629 RepID=A0A0C9X8X4_9AGAR|nr:hypothetical protein K443DRAFT_227238 [Laccaria amethystina LaAM-08-1]